jgi:hypothetical protein
MARHLPATLALTGAGLVLWIVGAATVMKAYPQGVLHLAVTRQHDAHRSRGALAHPIQKPSAIHAGHAHVGHHDIDRVRLHHPQGRLASRGEHRLPAGLLRQEYAPQPGNDFFIVVDEQNALHGSLRRILHTARYSYRRNRSPALGPAGTVTTPGAPSSFPAG